MAVYDERTHRAGVITGTLIVVLQVGKTWDEVSNLHGLSLISANDATNTYMATASRSPFDLEATFNSLKADRTNIAAVRIEVLSRTYRKN